MSIAADLASALRPVVETLNILNVSYYVTGSVASSVFGAVRATNDIDIVANITSGIEEKFFNSLKDKFYIDLRSIQEAIRHRRSFNVVHLESAFKLDIFIAKPTPVDRLMLERSIDVNLGIQPERLLVKFASPEDLILSKLRWYKEGGQIAEQQLRDIHGILNVQTKIDSNYLQNQAKAMGLADLLKDLVSD